MAVLIIMRIIYVNGTELYVNGALFLCVCETPEGRIALECRQPSSLAQTYHLQAD